MYIFYSSVGFAIFIWLYNHHHDLIPEHFYHSKNKSYIPQYFPSPVRWQWLIYFLSLWICLFWIFDINGIIKYTMAFCVWHLSHSIVFSRLVHIVTCINISFLLIAFKESTGKMREEVLATTLLISICTDVPFQTLYFHSTASHSFGIWWPWMPHKLHDFRHVFLMFRAFSPLFHKIRLIYLVCGLLWRWNKTIKITYFLITNTQS